jgi:hypothetical protein
MANVSLHPLFEQLRGKIKGLVFRLSYNGKISVYMDPDMSQVKWSAAQMAQREHFAAASAYAKAALKVPELRTIYVLRSLELKKTIARTIWPCPTTSMATTCSATPSVAM